MLNEKVSQLLNDQVNKEFYSAYLYLQFSNFYVEQGLAGFANWYKVQAQEERDHAMLMLQYLQNNDVPVTLEAVAKPDAELLMLLYNNFECMPFETVYGENDLGEINAVWRKMQPQLQKELYEFMKHGLQFMNSQTGDTEV